METRRLRSIEARCKTTEIRTTVIIETKYDARPTLRENAMRDVKL